MSAARQAFSALSRRITPLFDRVVIEKAEAVSKTSSGILIPEKAQSKVSQGTIIAVGPGARNDKGENVPLSVKIGDQVILPEEGGQKIEMENVEVFIYREQDIIAKLQD